uniref:Striatin 2 n=1 Tax=Cryptocotyle lingua TaxID=66766 RepID=A0A7U0TI86_9TREM|nr:striatin 2 [Cryptocotyle lingua]
MDTDLGFLNLEYEVPCDTNMTQGDQNKSGSNYNIRGVLHFLQSEWARMEAQRSDWATDRAELCARIAFLEGERRGQENLKQDLVRRIKMLEYALKQERVKFHNFKADVASSGGIATSQASLKSTTLDCTTRSSRSDLESSRATKTASIAPDEKLAQCTSQTKETNARWQESRSRLKKILQEIGCTDAVLSSRQARVLQLLKSSPAWRGALEMASGSDLKDNWASSRSNIGDTSASDDPLKAALAEMDEVVRGSYGTSSDLNTQRNIGSSSDEFAEPDTTGHSFGSSDMVPSSDGVRINRFRRTGGSHSQSGERKSNSLSIDSQQHGGSLDSAAVSTMSSFIDSLKPSGSPGQVKRIGHGGNLDKEIIDFISCLSDKAGDGTHATPNNAAQSLHTTTASTDWPSERQDIPSRTTLDAAEVAAKETNPTEGLLLGDLASLTVANEAETATEGDTGLLASSRDGFEPIPDRANVGGLVGDVDNGRVSTTFGYQRWTPRFTLRGHFDGIRSVAFHPIERALFSAGEDGCVMLWNLDKEEQSGSSWSHAKQAGRGSAPYSMDELDPFHIYRGHDGPVLCTVTPSAEVAQLIQYAAFSGGLDGTVRTWLIPPHSTNPELTTANQTESVVDCGPTLKGSSEAVWAIAVHPATPVLAVGHADNSIEFWSVADGPMDTTPRSVVRLDEQCCSLDLDKFPLGRITCLHYLLNRPDPQHATHLAVGTSTGWLFLLDSQTGQLVSSCPPVQERETSPTSIQNLPDGWGPSGLNTLVSHSTLSLLIGAHEDGYVRFYDPRIPTADQSEIGAIVCTDQMVAHGDAVSSLAVDSLGLYLLTGSHDASIRVWDLGSRTCVQEMTNPRTKYNEAVHTVALHPQFSLAASAGADGVCHIYHTSM